jgi:hypothetical protein
MIHAMAVGNIRKKLITYLADADEKKVKAIYTLLKKRSTGKKHLSCQRSR